MIKQNINSQPTFSYDLCIIGGGPAGLAAAIAARKNGIDKILILERDVELGGILNQCIHNGFGLHHFGEELTGPEYAARVIVEVKAAGIEYWLETMVLGITPEKVVIAINPQRGYVEIPARAIVLAMGCRERSRGAINLCGTRPAGIFTAGTAQRFINMEGYLPGKEIVILGSGDIGLIMARRLTLEGAKVHKVLEIMPYSNGLNRNLVQCLQDYNIPLELSTTVTKVHGEKRLKGISYAKVDEARRPIANTEKFIACDTLLLAVGLIPENEITRAAGIAIDPCTQGAVVNEMRETSKAGIFACGNVLQVHDIVDFVSREGAIAGIGAAQYLKGECAQGAAVAQADESAQAQGAAAATHKIIAGEGISYVVPQLLCLDNVTNDVEFYLRVKKVFSEQRIVVKCNGEIIATKKAPKFLPAEMVNIVVKKEQIKSLTGEIVIEIQP